MATTIAELTPNSLLTMELPEHGKYELSEGKLIVANYAGARGATVKSRILRLLFSWESGVGTSRVFSGAHFTLGVSTARIADVAVVADERIASIPDEDIVIPIAPDLAVEVISDDQSAYDAEKKVRQYLAAGVKEVWQVYPNERSVLVRWPEGLKDFKDHEPLRSRVLTGFEATVNQFFAD